MKNIGSFFLLFLFTISFSFAQAPKKPTAGEIYEAVKKLNFLGSVLYVAAHPDDENTTMISYFANEVKAQTAYLSLTRGDGGQNLIGPELRELLGVIRTQELIAARRIDGGQQFFTRANDFGYSKHPDETLNLWNKKEVLMDVVATIRKFKPDIIINRFNHRTPGTTHGHHTGSAMLSFEAFDLSGDSTYKTHLENDEVWQPRRLFFNTSWWFYGSRENFEKADKSKLISMDIGPFYSNLGLSNNEISSLSRSQHQSQGFGSTGSRGSQVEYVEFLKGDFPSNGDVFDGIDTSWNRVKGGEKVGAILKEVENSFDFKKPFLCIPKLVEALKVMENLDDSHWKHIKSREIKEVIAASAGLYLEAVASDPSATKNSEVSLAIEAINRSHAEIKLLSVSVGESRAALTGAVPLDFNKRNKLSMEVTTDGNASLTSPYWLHEQGTLGMYHVENKKLIGLPETPRNLIAEFELDIHGHHMTFKSPVVYKFNDPVKGEVYQPFEIAPEVSSKFEEKVYIFPDGNSQKVKLTVSAGRDDLKGTLSLKLDKQWKVRPSSIAIEISHKGAEKTVEFELTPPDGQSEAFIQPIVEVNGEEFVDETIKIQYDHIPVQHVVMPSIAKVVRLDIEKKGKVIGYIHGAGDAVPTSLRQMGYTVVELNESDVTAEKLKSFDAVVLGIRALNTNERVKFYQNDLHNYVEQGGTMIVQYNTSHRLKVPKVGPYPIKLSRDRVTDENSEVRIIETDHELMNYPNKITESDFDGWVQERGLYFPNEWDDRYDAPLGMNDKNESEKSGSLLVTKHGEGNYIYTGLSFFRELPAGVPGAYKLFANMLSIGKNKSETAIKD